MVICCCFLLLTHLWVLCCLSNSYQLFSATASYSLSIKIATEQTEMKWIMTAVSQFDINSNIIIINMISWENTFCERILFPFHSFFDVKIKWDEIQNFPDSISFHPHAENLNLGPRMLRCWAHLSVSSGDPRPLHITWWGGALSFPMEMTNWAIAWKRKERTEWINATTRCFSSPPDTWRKYGVLTKSNRYNAYFLFF